MPLVMSEYRFQKLNLTAEILKDYIDRNKMTFNNPRQRGVVWSREKKCYLITSMIIGCPTSIMYANRMGEVYDTLDGKQRCLTIYNFLSGKFKLGTTPNLIMPDGEEVVLSGKGFFDLPPRVQSQITGYNLDFQYAENLTEEQQEDVIIRLNSGKPMSAAELTKAQIKSVSEVTRLAKHPVFDLIMNEDAKEASKNTSLVMQIYMVLFAEDKCLLNAKVRQLLVNQSISPAEEEKLKGCMDFLLAALQEIENEKSDIAKRIKVILKRKVHFTSLFSVIDYAITEKISSSVFLDWMKYFFDAPIGQTSVCSEYNDYIGKGTNKSIAVTKRLDAMKANFIKYEGKI